MPLIWQEKKRAFFSYQQNTHCPKTQLLCTFSVGELRHDCSWFRHSANSCCNYFKCGLWSSNCPTIILKHILVTYTFAFLYRLLINWKINLGRVSIRLQLPIISFQKLFWQTNFPFLNSQSTTTHSRLHRRKTKSIYGSQK